ncbi:peroxisomal membrane protein 11C [Microplitis demolitor]|uniref:peroxisomal membrane protein 11C n=1 Tax=Microplitis demolitor TaxID=69319 RepID=UPI0004CCC72A|nr:peroxisomal membrane protein 11C [Microplitis demolitor]
MELISNYLESYEGRDKLLRTLSYAAKLATVIPRSEDDKKKFKIFGSQMSNCRIILRLLDDIPTLNYAIKYDWTNKATDPYIKWLEMIEIIVDVVYSPIETICWAGEHQLVNVDVDKWDTMSTWFWILSLYISLMTSLRKYKLLLKQKDTSLKNKSGNKAEEKALRHKMHNETLVCIRMLLDMSYAISYLPNGTLWGGKLSTWQVGALGTVSSLIGLYQSLRKRLH